MALIRRIALVLFVLSFFVLSSRGQQPASVRTVEIVAKRYAFEPGEITLKKGQPVKIVLVSADVAHGFAIKELGIHLVAKDGGRDEETITPDKTGEFQSKCNIFCGMGHASMRLTVKVTD
jgi:cytochrome c oxidase subunit 2